MRRPATMVAITMAAALLIPGAQAHAAGRALTMIPLFSQQFVLMQPENWAVALQYQDARTATVKLLPLGQNLGDWREMVAIQAFKGLAAHTEYGPEIMLRKIRSELSLHCAGELVSFPLEATTISGHKANGVLMGCPQANDDFGDFLPGLGEMALYVSIKGNQDFYVFRHAIRGARFNPETPPLNPGNFLDYADLTSPLLLCERGDSLSTCLARDGLMPGQGLLAK